MNKVTSTAPERIWLQVSDDADDCDLPFTYTYSDEVTWCEDSVTACQVEYVRADITEAENAALRALLSALRRIDWMQIILNQSAPCCFIENEDGRFCGRAERWAGHEHFHKFISLEAAIDAALLAGKEKP